MYLITSFVFFLLAGIMALLMRVQLLSPTSTFLSDQQYNELFIHDARHDHAAAVRDPALNLGLL
jgi:heme/copper-type cytochrome/quinol oxidase subunit 1